MKDLNNISDDQFDELFKKASQLVDPTFTEEAWEDMAQKLANDGNDKPPIFWNVRNILVSLALLLSLSFLGYKFLANSPDSIIVEKKSKEQSSKNITNTERTQHNDDDLFESNSHSLNQDESPLNSSEEVKSVDNSTVSSLKSNSAAAKKSIDNKALEFKARDFAEIEKPSINLAQSKIANSRKGKKSNSTLDPRKETNYDGNNNTSALQDFSKSELAELDVNKLDKINAKLAKTEKATFSSYPNDFEREQEKIEITLKEITQNKLYLTLGVSPDFSAVIDNSFLKMGHNWSAQLEYHFNNRWSLHSGVIISKKFYGSKADGMNWPEYWGAMPKEMQGMEASCNVIDIPVNIRFNLKSSPNTKMYALAGISNFIMMNEQYDYIYSDNFDQTGMMNEWSGKSNFLAAGMGNVAIGLERKVLPNFSIQVEPFVKIPLREFGFSQVKLVSAGVFFSGKIRIK